MMLLDAWMMLMLMYLNFPPCGFNFWVVTCSAALDGAAAFPHWSCQAVAFCRIWAENPWFHGNPFRTKKNDSMAMAAVAPYMAALKFYFKKKWLHWNLPNDVVWPLELMTLFTVSWKIRNRRRRALSSSYFQQVGTSTLKKSSDADLLVMNCTSNGIRAQDKVLSPLVLQLAYIYIYFFLQSNKSSQNHSDDCKPQR
jgi:hypothetical protein